MISEVLVNKLSFELNTFKESTLRMSNDYIFDNSYEISKKIDIASIFEYQDFDENIINTILSKDNSLDYVYNLLLKSDISLVQNMVQLFNNINTYY